MLARLSARLAAALRRRCAGGALRARLSRSFAVVALAGLLAGAASPTRAETTLTVSAAASLTEFAQSLAAMMEQAEPGVRVRLNIGGSDTLVTQALRGAPVDVLMLADDRAMRRAIDAGAVEAGAVQVFASNDLAVVSRRALGSARALAGPGVTRIAIGNPQTVPAGRYARDALQAAGLWDRLADRLVFTQNVRQALDYAVRGEADAAIVYGTDVAIVRNASVHAFELPGATPIRYPMAALASSRAPGAAARFVELARSEAARARLRELGFRLP